MGGDLCDGIRKGEGRKKFQRGGRKRGVVTWGKKEGKRRCGEEEKREALFFEDVIV